MQQLSVVMQRGNAVAVGGTVGGPTFLCSVIIINTFLKKFRSFTNHAEVQFLYNVMYLCVLEIRCS